MTDRVLDLTIPCDNCGEEFVFYVDCEDYLRFINGNDSASESFPYLSEDQIFIIENEVCPRCYKKATHKPNLHLNVNDVPPFESEDENVPFEDNISEEEFRALMRDLLMAQAKDSTPKSDWY